MPCCLFMFAVASDHRFSRKLEANLLGQRPYVYLWQIISKEIEEIHILSRSAQDLAFSCFFFSTFSLTEGYNFLELEFVKDKSERWDKIVALKIKIHPHVGGTGYKYGASRPGGSLMDTSFSPYLRLVYGSTAWPSPGFLTAVACWDHVCLLTWMHLCVSGSIC